MTLGPRTESSNRLPVTMVSTSAETSLSVSVAERAEQQHGADHAQQMPLAAEDGDAAQQHDGDDGEPSRPRPLSARAEANRKA